MTDLALAVACLAVGLSAFLWSADRLLGEKYRKSIGVLFALVGLFWIIIALVVATR